MRKVKNKTLILLGLIIGVISVTYISLKKVPMSDKELVEIIKLQVSKSSDFDGEGPFDIIFLGPYTMEIGDFGIIYYVRHLGAIPFSYRKSIKLISQIQDKKKAEKEGLERAHEKYLLKTLRDKEYKVE
jgi:hypothetical protein